MSPEPGFSKSARAFIATARPVAEWLARVRNDLVVVGRQHVPAGGMVLAGNHFSHIDPALGFVATRRSIHYLAVDELYGQLDAFDRLITWLGAVPMSRTRAPLGALKRAIELIASGAAVGLFPEGRRVWTWGETEPKRGAAWLAMATGAPLLPMVIEGSDEVYGRGAKWFAARPLRVTLGRPLQPYDYLDRVDPVGALTGEWTRWIDGHLGAELRSPARTTEPEGEVASAGRRRGNDGAGIGAGDGN